MKRPPKKTPSPSQSPLRARAESSLKTARRSLGDSSPVEMKSIIHELKVHQVELEMQNDELRRVQTDLEDSRDRLSQLYDSAPIGYLTLDPRGIIHEANLTAASLLGMERHALTKKFFSRFVSANSQDDLFLHFRRVFEAVQRQTCDLQMQRLDRTRFVGRLVSILERTTPGCPSRCLVAISDVSESIRARDELQQLNDTLEQRVAGRTSELTEAYERLRAITDHSEDMIYLTDRVGHLEFMNPAGVRLTGQTPPEFLSLPAVDASSQTAPARDFQGVNRKVLEAGQTTSLEETIIAASGQKTNLLTIKTPRRDPCGNVIGLIGISRDITERKRAEESLWEQERKYRSLVELSPDAILITRDDRILFLNAAGLVLFGASDSGLILGTSPFKFFPPEHQSSIRQRVGTLLAGGTSGPLIETEILRLDGSQRPVEIVASMIPLEGSPAVQIILRDVSQYRELEQEILQISESEQHRLGLELHDDICQQLTGIEFLAQGLHKRLSPKSKSEARQAAHLASLVRTTNQQIRDLSHGLAPVHLNLDGLVDALHKLAQRTRRVFQLDCWVRCPKPVAVENPQCRLHLYRIAQEAVSNAVKHGRATRIELRLTGNQHRVVLRIDDNGVGLPRIAGRGQGMGLRLMQYRANLIGATFVVGPAAKVGTSVVCTLPQSSRPRSNQGGK